MMEYGYTKGFDEKQMEELFKSVKWFSGNFPGKLKQHCIIQAELFPHGMEKS